jgi:hypothetical protein
MKESGGGFNSKVNGATKYGMLRKQGNELILTDLADKYFHNIDENEKEEALFKSFTSVPLFRELVEKFKGKKIEKKTLESLLIRMHDVNRNVASKVAWYFLKANSKYNFLESTSFMGDQDEDEFNEERIAEDELICKTQRPLKTTKNAINESLFELILNLGYLVHDETMASSAEILESVKQSLNDNKEQLSHSELFADIISLENKATLYKLKEALRKDLGVTQESEE